MAELWTPADMVGVTGLEWFDSTKDVSLGAQDGAEYPVVSWLTQRPAGGTRTAATSFRDDFRPFIRTVNGKQSVYFNENTRQLSLSTAGIPGGAGNKFWFIATKNLETRNGDYYPFGYGASGGTGVTWKMRQGQRPYSDIGGTGLNVGAAVIATTGISIITEAYRQTGTLTRSWYNGQAEPSTLVATRNSSANNARLGHWPQYGNGANQHLLRLGWCYGEPTDDDILRLQGWLSWDTGDNGASLRADHPYKNAPPYKSGGAQGYVLLAETGSFAASGRTAGMARGYQLTASTGVFQLGAPEVSSRLNRVLPANSGSFMAQFLDGGFRMDRRLSAAGGAYTLGMVDAVLRRGHLLVAAAGAFVTQTVPAALVRGFRLIAQGTAFEAKANEVVTRYERRLAAGRGEFYLTGLDTGARRGRRLAAEAATYALTGRDIQLRRGGGTILSGGTFTMTGGALGLRRDRLLVAAPGTFTLLGRPAALRRGYVLPAEGAQIRLSGRPVVLRTSRLLRLAGGAFLVTGGDVSLRLGRRERMDTGVFIFTGQPAGLIRVSQRTLRADRGAYSLQGLPIVFFKVDLQHRILLAETGAYLARGGEARLYRSVPAPPRQTLGAPRRSRVRGGGTLNRKLGG